MNSYFFTGWVSRWHQGHFVDACSSLILYGKADAEAAERVFEEALLSSGGPDNPVPVRIERIVAAPILEQLFTETGFLPLDWKQVAEEVLRSLEAAAESDDFAQGYWVDCNQWPAPRQLSLSIESLQAELPEDIRSGLNWSADRQHYFLLSVLSAPEPPPQFREEVQEQPRAGANSEDADALDAIEEPGVCPFAEVAQKEAAVLVRARNSVVAAWLWRKHAAATPLAGNAIRLDSPSEAVPIEKPETAS